MLDYIWSGMILISIFFAFFENSPDSLMNAAFSGAENAVTTVISITGMMCLWSGLAEIAKRAGMIRILSRILKPLIAKLFPEIKNDEECTEPIVMNISANLMGMSNAATPLGLKAIERLKKKSSGKLPTNAMCTLVILNTASIQLIPSTMIALRSSAGSVAPSEIILPVWITSLAALLVGLAAAKLMEKRQ